MHCSLILYHIVIFFEETRLDANWGIFHGFFSSTPVRKARLPSENPKTGFKG